MLYVEVSLCAGRGSQPHSCGVVLVNRKGGRDHGAAPAKYILVFYTVAHSMINDILVLWQSHRSL